MTKILHIPSGTYCSFISSTEYDHKHGKPCYGQVTVFEDSHAYSFHKLTPKQAIQITLDGTRNWVYGCDGAQLENEFEIIYD